MQHMFGNDPKFQQAMKMAQGKTPDQLKETTFNLAKTHCVPNTVYTPTAPTVPTVEVLED